MITIIAGSRYSTFTKKTLENALSHCNWPITEIISGGAKGVDTFAQQIAEERAIPFRLFPAQWERFGKSAGYKRNIEMAENADALIAIWDGKSKGTQHMINIARNKGLRIMIYKEVDGVYVIFSE